MENEKGKLIVLDGIDGTGKSTQTKILADRLLQDGYKVKMAHFPQYGTKSAGLVEEYLSGKYGTAEAVGPYRASIFYAADRYDAGFKIKSWLDSGHIVLIDRYVSANMGHQGGKIIEVQKRKKFLHWVYNLEYNLFQIPKPDISIILHAGADIAQKMIENREIRSYLCGEKRDIHEADIRHLRAAEKTYLEIAEYFPNFTLINCAPNQKMLKRDEIHNLIWNKVLAQIDPERFANEQKQKFTGTSGLITLIAQTENDKDAKKISYDLFANEYASLAPGNCAEIMTGIKLAIPENHFGLLVGKEELEKNGIYVLGQIVDSKFHKS